MDVLMTHAFAFGLVRCPYALSMAVMSDWVRQELGVEPELSAVWPERVSWSASRRSAAPPLGTGRAVEDDTRRDPTPDRRIECMSPSKANAKCDEDLRNQRILLHLTIDGELRAEIANGAGWELRIAHRCRVRRRATVLVPAPTAAVLPGGSTQPSVARRRRGRDRPPPAPLSYQRAS